MSDRSLQVLRDVAMATNFGTKFAITGFVGSNFGCMIASNTLFDSRDAESGGSRKYVLHTCGCRCPMEKGTFG